MGDPEEVGHTCQTDSTTVQHHYSQYPFKREKKPIGSKSRQDSDKAGSYHLRRNNIEDTEYVIDV